MKHRATLFHYSPCTFIVIVFMDTAGSPCMCDIMNSASWLHLIRAALLSVCCQHHQPPVWEAFIYFFYLNLHKCQSIRVLPAGTVPVVLLAARLKTDRRNACWHFLAFIIQGNAGKLQRAEILTHLSRICEQGRKSVGSNMIVLSMESEK